MMTLFLLRGRPRLRYNTIHYNIRLNEKDSSWHSRNWNYKMTNSKGGENSVITEFRSIGLLLKMRKSVCNPDALELATIIHRCKKTLIPKIKKPQKARFEKNKKTLKTLNKKRCWQINKIAQPNDKIPQ